MTWKYEQLIAHYEHMFVRGPRVQDRGDRFYNLKCPFSTMYTPKKYTHIYTHIQKKYGLWEQEPLNCVGYITSTQAGRAPLQLAQSKAGWINWSGPCANEVRSLLSPLVLLGQIIWAHLSWWISGCEWNGLVECHCAFTPLTSMTPSRGRWRGCAAMRETMTVVPKPCKWTLAAFFMYSLAGRINSFFWRVSYPLLTRWLEHGLIVSILKDFCLLRHETKGTPVMSGLKGDLLI